MPMPRAGVETLRLAGGADLYRAVVHGHRSRPFQFTQRLFLASPGGRYLAFQDTQGHKLVILGGDGPAVIAGVRAADFRFSADGRYLATVRSEPDGSASLVLFELARGQGRVLGSVGRVRWLEWVEGGVVVNEHRDERARLSYFPLAGVPVELAADDALEARFSTARRGSRVLYFARGRAYTVEVGDAEPAPVDRGAVPGTLQGNVEMAPDGSEAALVTTQGVFRWTERTGAFEKLAPSGYHSLWYSADGSQLAYAGLDGAVVRARGKTFRFSSPRGDLRALRFRQGGDGLLVTAGDRLYLWQPLANARRIIATGPAGETLLGADQFAGGTVLWTQKDVARPKSGKKRR